uniref:Uncharacterized protein n=1 Tax=Arundo donax TaxID=35708 RepID=A0A0A9F617_ARUDO
MLVSVLRLPRLWLMVPLRPLAGKLSTVTFPWMQVTPSHPTQGSFPDQELTNLVGYFTWARNWSNAMTSGEHVSPGLGAQNSLAEKVKLSALMGGTGPRRLLLSSCTSLSWGMVARLGGTRPTSMLLLSLRLVRPLQAPMPSGMGPENSLPCSQSTWRLVMVAMTSRGPESILSPSWLLRRRLWMPEALKVEGMGPERLL